MRLEITDETHNHVEWVVRWPVIWIELSLLVGLSVLSVFMLLSTHPARWILLGIVGGFTLVVGVAIAATTPLHEEGYLERLPDGGELSLTYVWLGLGRRTIVALPFQELDGFVYETQDFEKTERATYTMARLWASTQAQGLLKLSAWGNPVEIEPLGEVLSKAARRPLKERGQVVNDAAIAVDP
jgi:hypothetical protein